MTNGGARKSRAARWRTAISSLREHALRVELATREIEGRPAVELAEALDEICRCAERGERDARDVLLAFVAVLVDPKRLARTSVVRAAAERGGFGVAARLLGSSSEAGYHPPAYGREEGGMPSTQAQASLHHADGRPLTLGERRALARTPTRAVLRRLLRDGHPMVVELLLANPRLTEQDVVDMAVARPATPSTLAEIACRFTRHARVRRAVVLNPGCPPAISVPLLALLSRPELYAVSDAMDLPPVVRHTAKELADRRPPREGALELQEIVELDGS